MPEYVLNRNRIQLVTTGIYVFKRSLFNTVPFHFSSTQDV